MKAETPPEYLTEASLIQLPAPTVLTDEKAKHLFY